jgi:membrane fusion protein, copper/silver efflux system
MSERDSFSERAAPAIDLQERGLRPPPGLGFWRRVWWWLDFLVLVKLARLRFLAVLVAIGGVIAYWDTLHAYYEKWTRPPAAAEAAAGPDTEFWCPMHPTIVRDHADKCPICGMPLSKRKKGEGRAEEPLPAGVVSRVQLTPYRVALAGVRTAEVGYQALAKEINAVGFVEFDERRLARIAARVTGKSRIDKLYVNVTGQTVRKGEPLAELYSPDLVVTVRNLLDARSSGNQELQRSARDRLQLWGIDKDQIEDIVRTGKPITRLTIRAPISGHVIRKYQVEGEYVEEGARLYDVADLSSVWIEAQIYEDELAFLKEGLPIRATTKAFPNRVFQGKLAFLYPHLDAATRTLRVRFDMDNPDHALRPGMYVNVKLQVPLTELAPLAAAARNGEVLAVPERAVIDTGSRKIVYREAEPGVYEGVEVQLGPRSGGFYAVARGLAEGDRVATAGSFLIDAETRLTGGVGATYFGASGGPHAEHRPAATARPSTPKDEGAEGWANLAKLSPEDRRVAEAQRFCAVHNENRLGAMGVPAKLLVKGQPVFLCCEGCEDAARKDAEKTLAKVKQLKAQAQAENARQGARP